MSSHWSLDHRPTGRRLELAKHSTTAPTSQHQLGVKLSLKAKKTTWKMVVPAREDFYVGWKLSPQSLLHLLSLNKGKETQRERAHLVLTSSLHSGSPMLLATGKWSLQGCSGEIQGPTGKSEVPGLGSIFMLAHFIPSICPPASSWLPRVFLSHSQRYGLTWERTNLQME